MNSQIAAVIAQTNAAMYYHCAMHGKQPVKYVDNMALYRIRMQQLAARHSAAARRAMGVE